MQVLQRAAFVSVFIVTTGCAVFVAEETRYLESAQDRATKDEVRHRLGQPFLTTPARAGESTWVYQVRTLEPGSQSAWSAFGSWCDEYVLTFDQHDVLRRWSHKSQKHGGETMPSYCVVDEFKQVS